MGLRARGVKDPKNPAGDSRDSGIPDPFQARPRRRSKVSEFPSGIWGAPLRQRSSSEATLSECDGAEAKKNPENPGIPNVFFREYGSTSSIDIQGIPEQSFYEMLKEFRAKKPEFSAGKEEFSTTNKEKRARRCLKNDESIFKKFRNIRPDPETKEQEEERWDNPGKSGICRKAFAHFDVQSLYFQAVSVGMNSSPCRNVTTGASAASRGGDNSQIWDLGDATSNELLLSCPHFRNEIGTTTIPERDVGFGASALPAPSGFFWDFLGNFGKGSNAGVALLELPAGAAPTPRGYSVEHADPGARYYREYFHGKGLGMWGGMGKK
ncbi:SI1L3 protein, partial [Certhia brachydactyla]|nr:SI1L3 protein [Certhia brachydactyla]